MGQQQLEHDVAEPAATTNDGSAQLPIEYVLPLKWRDTSGDEELGEYLGELSRWVHVTVVDGSPEPVFEAHRQAWGHLVRHVAPEGPPLPNGKVHGVLTGLRLARYEHVVIADDDVRYTRESLAVVHGLLERYDLVRVQNYFDPLPWHARWDTARSLINRALASDYPGTLAVRKASIAGGYRGDVLFENLEMIRTVLARGGTQYCADDVFVRRLPPTDGHFWGQRVRQAYDSQAQPARLALEMSLLPLVIGLRRKPWALAGLAAATMLLAEWGRRGAGKVFPPSTVLFAPLWVGERAVTSWMALRYRLVGGVPYAGGRLLKAASSLRELRETTQRNRSETKEDE